MLLKLQQNMEVRKVMEDSKVFISELHLDWLNKRVIGTIHDGSLFSNVERRLKSEGLVFKYVQSAV